MNQAGFDADEAAQALIKMGGDVRKAEAVLLEQIRDAARASTSSAVSEALSPPNSVMEELSVLGAIYGDEDGAFCVEDNWYAVGWSRWMLKLQCGAVLEVILPPHCKYPSCETPLLKVI